MMEDKEKKEKKEKKTKKKGLRRKLLVLIIVMFLGITIAMQGVVAWIYISWTKLHYAENAMSNAQIAASMIDGDSMDT